MNRNSYRRIYTELHTPMQLSPVSALSGPSRIAGFLLGVGSAAGPLLFSCLLFISRLHSLGYDSHMASLSSGEFESIRAAVGSPSATQPLKPPSMDSTCRGKRLAANGNSRRVVAVARASNGMVANRMRMVRMTLDGIVRMTLLGFLVSGVAAQVSPQSPPSLADGAEQSSRSSQAQSQVELSRFSLLGGTSIDVAPDWIEREQMPLPPSPRLARFAPHVTFLEFSALENPRIHSVLRIATTTNSFLGGDEVALDTQMHSAGGSGNSLADYLFYFFFSPPRDCLDGGSEAFTKAKSQETPDRTRRFPWT
jgi:hypothetical protein